VISGLVLVNCYLDQDYLAETAIRQIQGVLEVHRTHGVYDLVVKVQAADEQQLQKVVKEIRSAHYVQSVLTNVIYRQDADTQAA
jgi:DNA-binding Lrp family transcriptional regulator